jgi:multidrug transporter EmrE-like cation transporter
MKNFEIWLNVAIAVFIALAANYTASMWANSENKPLWFILMLLISPLVFITFGLTTSRLGVSISSGTIDSLLTISTVMIGLIFFQEWNKVSMIQYIGIAFALCGIFLMVFSPKHS